MGTARIDAFLLFRAVLGDVPGRRALRTMSIDPALIECIYEAAALPERWPGVMDAIADMVGAFGATIVAQRPGGSAILASPRIASTVADYIAEGWAADTAYAAPLIADQYPGFRAETHYRTIEEIERLPVHRDFLAPRGLVAGVGTVLHGARDAVVHVALEGLPTHAAAERAVPLLDRLRAPLGRALSLSGQVIARQEAVTVTALELAGLAAAVVAVDGRLRAVNDLFVQRFGAAMDTLAGRVRFADRFLQAQLERALATLDASAGVRSIAAPATGESAPFAVHLLPLRRGARDVFEADGVLMLVAEAANASAPTADLLRLLFDLTPAEARMTRLLLEGRTPAEAAARLGITEATARTHLRRVFGKTGVHRQAELIHILSGLGGPVER